MNEGRDLKAVLREARTIVTQSEHDDGSESPAERLALETARETGARVVLYQLQSASVLSSPTPTEWDADRDEPADFEQPLEAADLEKLGRQELAHRLAELRLSGVEAVAWLPDSPGVDAMVEVAGELRADVILVDRGADKPNPVERLVGAEEAEEAAHETRIPILEVAPGGAVTEM